MYTGRRFGMEFEHASSQEYSILERALASAGVATDPFATGHPTCPQRCYNGWQVKTDGSISGEDGHRYPVELTSPPLTLRDYKQVFTALRVVRPHSRLNSSCGLHIHVAAPELRGVATGRAEGAEEWREKIKATWLSVEPLFFTYVVPSRRNNDYCLPGVNWTHKYRAMNLNPLGGRGTIEFRLHSGTLNPHKALAFAKLCLYFVEYMVKERARAFPELKLDVELPVPPKRILHKKHAFHIQRVDKRWVIEEGRQVFTFETLRLAHKELRTHLELPENPFVAFHMPQYGNAMTQLCKQLGINGLSGSYLQDRYDTMLLRYGPWSPGAASLVVSDEANFYNEPDYEGEG